MGQAWTTGRPFDGKKSSTRVKIPVYNSILLVPNYCLFRFKHRVRKVSQYRSTAFSLALVGGLLVSANAFADNSRRGSGHEDGEGFYSAWHHSDWAWALDLRTMSKLATDAARRVPSAVDVSEGLSAAAGSAITSAAGTGQGRGGAAPAPLLGLTLLGQFGIGAGLIAAIRRRRARIASTVV